MRLLNVHSLEFAEFFDRAIPPYVILSHTWGEDEVSYKQFRKTPNEDHAGYKKIRRFCDFVKARRFGCEPHFVSSHQSDGDYAIHWVWIDTINEGTLQCLYSRLKYRLRFGPMALCSSAELSEAINSMFTWYSNAVECIAYLVDVRTGDDPTVLGLQQSNWFCRGWTLQELLAPELIVFCNVDWQVLGHVCPCCHINNDQQHQLYGSDLSEEISDITGISPSYLRWPGRVQEASVAQKMSWAAHRRTTRLEDEAYCLLGLLQINMPLIYGEGKRAFRRLQEEVIKQSTDQTIFAWSTKGHGEPVGHHRIGHDSILAAGPRYFAGSSYITRDVRAEKRYVLTNAGLELNVELRPLKNASAIHLLDLACRDEQVRNDTWKPRQITIAIAKSSDSEIWSRVWTNDLGERFYQLKTLEPVKLSLTITA